MSNINKFGSLLRSEMHKVSQYNIGFGNIALGRITGSSGLKVDGLDYTVPSGDYSVCRTCADDLTSGKRVLVAFFNNEPIVVDIVGNDELGIAQNHNHDERYYTESEVDSKLSEKADKSHSHSEYAANAHTHDDRYYTESETDTLISQAQSNAQALVSALSKTVNKTLEDYAKADDIPTVPTNVSAFNNDAGYLTEHQNLEGYAKTEDIPIFRSYRVVL